VQKCSKCKERGATIGCFEPKCTRSFHLPCTDKPLEHFEMGVIFYCPTHEAFYDKRGTDQVKLFIILRIKLVITHVFLT